MKSHFLDRCCLDEGRARPFWNDCHAVVPENFRVRHVSSYGGGIIDPAQHKKSTGVMDMSNLKFKLVVEQDGKDVYSEELGFRVLRDLNLVGWQDPDISIELMDFLAHHPDPEISGKVAGNNQISDASLELLAQSQQKHIRSELIDNGRFQDWASTDLLLEYVRADAEIAERIASRLGYFHSADANAIADTLLKHPNPMVRYNMADDWSDIPKKLLKVLQNDPDTSVRAMATRKLKDK